MPDCGRVLVSPVPSSPWRPKVWAFWGARSPGTDGTQTGQMFNIKGKSLVLKVNAVYLPDASGSYWVICVLPAYKVNIISIWSHLMEEGRQEKDGRLADFFTKSSPQQRLVKMSASQTKDSDCEWAKRNIKHRLKPAEILFTFSAKSSLNLQKKRPRLWSKSPRELSSTSCSAIVQLSGNLNSNLFAFTILSLNSVLAATLALVINTDTVFWCWVCFCSPQRITHRRHHLCTGMFQFCQKYVTVSEFLEEEPDKRHMKARRV